MSEPVVHAPSASSGAVAAPAPDANPAPRVRRRVALIVNPHATTTNPRKREAVLRALDHRYDVHPMDTEAPGHATELARQAAADGADAVFALGGDGTANEAANGLVGGTVPLLPLPGGATNVYHRLLGIPRTLEDATDHVLRLADDWHPRPTDLARINDRWFTFAAGIGLDAAVVRNVDRHPRMKRRLGPWYYTASAVSTFLREYVAHAPRLSVELPDGQVLEGRTAIFQNGMNYTYFAAKPIRLLHDQGLESGTLSGAVLSHTRPTIMPGVIARALISKLDLGNHAAVAPTGNVPEVTVRSTDGRPMPTHVDGDFIGAVDVAHLSVTPRALWVVS